MTNLRRDRREEPLDLDLFAADAVRLVPVDFREVEAAIVEADRSDSLALSPSTWPLGLAQATQLADLAPSGDRLYVDDWPDDLEHGLAAYKQTVGLLTSGLAAG
jgi:hypothetical protein